VIWVTADTHFGHNAILRQQPLRGKAFTSIEEHDDYLIDAINRTVSTGDEFWHLGDFCWRSSRAGHYRQQIRYGVQLHMCRGNHDAASLRKHCSSLEHIIVRKPSKGLTVVLCHYPLWSWPNSCHGSYHFYGHCHGMAEEQLNMSVPDRLSLDVGVDAAKAYIGDWRPLSMDEAISLCNKRRKRSAD